MIEDVLGRASARGNVALLMFLNSVVLSICLIADCKDKFSESSKWLLFAVEVFPCLWSSPSYVAEDVAVVVSIKELELAVSK